MSVFWRQIKINPIKLLFWRCTNFYLSKCNTIRVLKELRSFLIKFDQNSLSAFWMRAERFLPDFFGKPDCRGTLRPPGPDSRLKIISLFISRKKLKMVDSSDISNQFFENLFLSQYLKSCSLLWFSCHQILNCNIDEIFVENNIRRSISC